LVQNGAFSLRDADARRLQRGAGVGRLATRRNHLDEERGESSRKRFASRNFRLRNRGDASGEGRAESVASLFVDSRPARRRRGELVERRDSFANGVGDGGDRGGGPRRSASDRGTALLRVPLGRSVARRDPRPNFVRSGRRRRALRARATARTRFRLPLVGGEFAQYRYKTTLLLK